MVDTSARAAADSALAKIETFEFDYAFASLILYDYVLSIGYEVEYFWTGKWSLSRFLYLAIRYLSLVFALFMIMIAALTPNMPKSDEPTMVAIEFGVFVVPIVVPCQSVITLRVWFLFPRNLTIRIFAVALLVASTISTVLVWAVEWKMIRNYLLNAANVPQPSTALIYVPSLVIHTVLFVLKVYRFLTSSVNIRTDSLLWGFLKEGMFMYACAAVSLLFGTVGLTMVKTSQLPVRAPAASGSPIVALIALSVCRAMLSIRSVAATGHVDPEWLLNHAELSRVHWRRGNVDGEIVVESGEATIPLVSKHIGP